jgi:putative sterol carrier protein
MSEEVTIEQMMERMPKAFIPEKAGNTDVTIQYQLSGAEPGDWLVTIRNGACTVQKGTGENPTMTLIADSQVYKDMIMGKIAPMKALMEGNLKLQGNLTIAMKLMEYFKLT